MATGVLVVGVGSGTKQMQSFLHCTKTYDTVLLFGAASDTYDVKGKIIGKAPYAHVTREKVEQALSQFRGNVMQKPPVFSAIRVDGKRMYEYAREGGKIPEVALRPVEVSELELLEWYEGGSHGFQWPEDEAPEEEKVLAEKLLHISDKEGASGRRDRKRKLESDGEDGAGDDHPKRARQVEPDLEPSTDQAATPRPLMSGALKPLSPDPTSTEPVQKPTAAHPRPPAARLRLTVSSGFYVRSLCHDLGAAVGSLGMMASLVRSRQGEFEVGKNVFEYGDLQKGEEVWAPRVRELLEAWHAEPRKGTESGEARGDGSQGRKKGRSRGADGDRNSSSEG